MDPIFYPTSTGLPSESKLASYMVAAQSSEFIPQRINASPNFYAPFQHTLLSGGINNLSNTDKTNSPTSFNSAAMCAANISANNGETLSNCVNIASIDGETGNVCNVMMTSVISKTAGGNTTNLLQQGKASADAAQHKQTVHHAHPQQSPQQQHAQAYMVNSTLHPNLLSESPHGLLNEKTSSPLVTPQPQPSPCAANILPTNVHQENVGGTIYFYPTANAPNNGAVVEATNVGPQHTVTSTAVTPMTPVPSGMAYSGHIYPGPASHIISMQSKSQLETAFFMPDEMRAEILARNEISNLMLDSLEAAQHTLPLDVDNYHSLYPLESMQPLHGKLAMLSSTYKATHCTTGIKYCLRRLHGFRLQSTKCMTMVDLWKKLSHSNIAQLREIFTTKAFGDNSLVLVYDYYPGSQTLLSKYFTPTAESNGYTDPFQGEARPFSHKSTLIRTSIGPLISEATIWAIIMQLTAGLRAMHQAGLACRALDASKIILTGKRVRFSFCGVVDIANFDPNVSNPLTLANLHQQEDLTALGRLVLSLACRCLNAVQRENVQASIDLVARHYSSDLRNFIVYLFTTQRRSVTDLMPMIGARFYTQLEALQSQCDMQEDELSKEMENGRLYRMLVKLNYINERPDFNMDVTWSETGDRYMLKLFRDYLFHSVTDDGRPWLDHAHVLHCLNKLDAGSMERVQLMSRDEQSLLIVTYAELKNCLENAFAELMANAA